MTESRTLLLLRHAKSSWDDAYARDEDRGLAPRGERAAAAVGVWLRQQDLRPDLVLCSPSVRTRQTLSLVLEAARAWPLPEIRHDPELYLAAGRAIVDRIAAQGGSHRRLLVVGHHPGLPDAARLLGGDEGAIGTRIGEKFPTAALVRLEIDGEWDALAPGDALLRDYVVPKELL